MSPPLSNFLTVLAIEIAGEVAAFKRGSLAAHTAYLTAAAKLVDARGECRRGQWQSFLAAAGVESRTAQHMMMLSRAGMTPDRMTELGGVRAALESLRTANEKTETVSGNAFPEPADVAPESRAPLEESAPVAHGTGLATGEPPAVRESGPQADLSPAKRRRASRRYRGLCVDCGSEAHGRARCARCRSADSARGRRTRRRARMGEMIEARVNLAHRHGRGLRLTAADVRDLVDADATVRREVFERAAARRP